MEAAGRMGMSEHEFEITTPRYFFHRRKGFESVQQEQARNARQVAFYSAWAYLKKGSKPKDLYPLPGDDEHYKKTREYSEEDRARLVKALKAAKDVDFFKGETLPKLEA